MVAVAARPRSHVAMAAAAAAVGPHPPSVASFSNEQLIHTERERERDHIEQHLGDPSISTASNRTAVPGIDQGCRESGDVYLVYIGGVKVPLL